MVIDKQRLHLVKKVEIKITMNQAFFAFALGFVCTLTLQSSENYKQAQSPQLEDITFIQIH